MDKTEISNECIDSKIDTSAPVTDASHIDPTTSSSKAIVITPEVARREPLTSSTPNNIITPQLLSPIPLRDATDSIPESTKSPNNFGECMFISPPDFAL